MADPEHVYQQPSHSQDARNPTLENHSGMNYGQPIITNGQYLPQMPNRSPMTGNPQVVKHVTEPQRNLVAGPPSYQNWHNQPPVIGNAPPTQQTREPHIFQAPTNIPNEIRQTPHPQNVGPSASLVNGPIKMNELPRHPLTNGVQPSPNNGRMMTPPMNRPLYPNQVVQPSAYSSGMMAPRPPIDLSRHQPQTLPLPTSNHPSGFVTPSPVTSEPASTKSSRNPSPEPSLRYDIMEGQFPTSPNSNGHNAYVGNQPAIRSQAPTPTQWSSQPPFSNNPQLQRMNLPTSNYLPSVPTIHDGFQQSYSHAPPMPSLPLGSVTGQQVNAGIQRLPSQGYPKTMTNQDTGGSTIPASNVPSVDQWNSQQPQQRMSASALTGPMTNRVGHQFSNLSLQSPEVIDLLQTRNILPPTPVEPPKIILPSYDMKPNNSSPDIFRCTLTKVPESQSVLHKSRLPLGILIHPFKDLTQLPVVQCNVIVRCRSCRTYINPFVHFIDQRRWKCNLCFRVNELQEEFQYDPITKSYGDPTRRPEIKSATIEFIAPSEYMLRPPQPAVYLFVLDVSFGAIETGYLRSFCEVLLENLEKLPGDGRTQIGFITFDSTVHFYNIAEGLSQPQMMVVSDIQDVFLPCPDNLLVNLHENKDLVKDLLQQIPIQFTENHCPDSALGAALEAAHKLVSGTGGRITVLQVALPNVGPGALKSREDPNLRAGKEVPNLGPASDYYKKLSLNCSSQQVAVDLFILSSQYCDIATLSCISKYSGGCTHYYPGLHSHLNPRVIEKFERDFKRYLTRKIGLEAVMRIRCTKGLSIHTFHGNFFVRSTDLLSLPNINPDAGFAMQMSIEEALTDSDTACFQAALLYTSCKGERRIRVHTLCLPVTASVHEVINGADQQAIVGLLTKMAVDRSLSSSMSDARDALINACVDAMAAFRVVNGGNQPGLQVPASLKLLPMYILAILKHICFRLGTSTKLDERVFAMNQMKTLPLTYLIPYIYPVMYAVHNLDEKNCILQNDMSVPQPPILCLSSEKFERQGAFLLDAGEKMFLYICQGISQRFCQNVLNVSCFEAIPENLIELPELETPESERLRAFVKYQSSLRPFHPTFHILRSDSKSKGEFIQLLVEDRTESSYSYYEFLKHLHQLMTK